jgi:hypothetical protein
MSTLKARPAFGAKQNLPEYYTAVNSIISVLRETATLRTIAAHLNKQAFVTPTGKPWTRERVATYLQSTAAASI